MKQHIHHLESTLLRPRDPAQHSDDWPIFDLTSAEIHSPSIPSEPASLLDADVDNALTLRGRLSRIPQSLSHLRVQETAASIRGQTELIEVSDVRAFAYGQYDDGSLAIWAAGGAGWFCVQPSRAYRAVYDGMVEAVEMLYHAADMYKTNKRREEVSASAVFEAWAAAKGLMGREEEAAEAFYRHAKFLLVSMLGEKEGVRWLKTPLYKHLQQRFEDVDQVLRKKKGLQPVRRQSKSATPSVQAGLKRKRSESASMSLPTAKEPRLGDTIAVRPRSETVEQDVTDPQAGRVSLVERSRRSQSRLSGLFALDTQPSIPKGKTVTQAATKLEEESDDSEPPTQGRKGRSILRPRPSKYISKTNAETATEEDETQSPTSPVRLLALADNNPEPKGNARLSRAMPPPRRRISQRNTTSADQAVAGAADVDAVSYTHLTLPTIYSV